MKDHASNLIGAVTGTVLLSLPFVLWLLGVPQ